MFGGAIGGQELFLILLLVLVLFGAKKIPEIMRGFGQGLREFKAASQKAMDEIDEATRAEPLPASTAAASSSPEQAPKIDPH